MPTRRHPAAFPQSCPRPRRCSPSPRRTTSSSTPPTTAPASTTNSDFVIWRRPGGPDFTHLTVWVSNTGSDWTQVTSSAAYGTSGNARAYDIGGNSGATYKYLQLRNGDSTGFQLDSIQ